MWLRLVVNPEPEPDIPELNPDWRPYGREGARFFAARCALLPAFTMSIVVGGPSEDLPEWFPDQNVAKTGGVTCAKIG